MKNKQVIIHLGFALVSAFIIVFMLHVTKYCCFCGDDAWFSVYAQDEKLFGCIFGPERFGHGGYYIGVFLCKFISYKLPLLIGIHPEDFIGGLWYGARMINGIFTVIALLLIAKFAIIQSKSPMLYFLTFFFLSGWFFYNTGDTSVIMINYTYYRYFFSLIFCCIFWSYICCRILNKDKTSVYLLISAVLCGFILGTSVEILFYSSVFAVCLLILYNAVLSLLSLYNVNFKIHKFNLKLDFYIPVIGLLSGTVLMALNPGSIEVAKERGLNHITITLDSLKEFLNLYYEIYFHAEYIYWIIFIITASIALFTAIKKKEFKNICLPLIIQLSIITVIFSLILCGKTYDETTRDRYFLVHPNIIFLYRMLIIIPLLMIVDYLYKNMIKDNRLLQILFMIFILSAGVIYMIKAVNQGVDNEFYEIKKKYYISEKIFRFYVLKNQVPLIPSDLNESFIYPFRQFYDIRGNTVKNDYAAVYYKRVYNQDITELLKDGYYISDNAVEKFYKNGGTFTERELKRLKFTRLKDEDFVLNKI